MDEDFVPELPGAFQKDISIIRDIEAVPNILQVVCHATGMGFAAVARVTEGRWIACSVLDQINFGLKPGGELKVETTICHEIRQSGQGVVIDHVAEDEVYCGHPTPAMYGFQSYISIPIILCDGTMFGTLCAIDPKPHRLKIPGIRHVQAFRGTHRFPHRFHRSAGVERGQSLG
jgi:GAF domain-containing protein